MEAEDKRTNYLERQLANRASVKAFFADPKNYKRLETIMDKGESICSIVMFFVSEYSKNKVFRTATGISCPNDSYRYALRSNLKRFYDFENRAGHGELWFEGILNPRILANEALGSLALSLPRLVALAWFIKSDFDAVFWERFEDITNCYNAFTMRKKRMYTETHKLKKKLMRQRIEQSVIQSRDVTKSADETKVTKKKVEAVVQPPTKRKETRLSRVDRRRVVALIAAEKLRLRESLRLVRTKNKKRQTKQNPKLACVAPSESPPLLLDFSL